VSSERKAVGASVHVENRGGEQKTVCELERPAKFGDIRRALLREGVDLDQIMYVSGVSGDASSFRPDEFSLELKLIGTVDKSKFATAGRLIRALAFRLYEIEQEGAE